jgi:hypothetical protein
MVAVRPCFDAFRNRTLVISDARVISEALVAGS